MTINEKTQIASHVAVIILCGVVAICVVLVTENLGQIGTSLVASAGSLSDTMKSTNETLIDVDNAIQKVNGKTGTITEIDKLLLALKSTTVHIDMAARHEDQQLTVLDGQERQLFSDLHGTAIALTGTAQQATATLAEGQTSIRAAQPLLAAYTASGNDLDTILKDQSIHRILQNLDGVTLNTSYTMENVAGVTQDAKKVSDDLTKTYFAPRPWYRRIGPFLEAGAKITNEVLPW